jgi:hypothetical protein
LLPALYLRARANSVAKITFDPAARACHDALSPTALAGCRGSASIAAGTFCVVPDDAVDLATRSLCRWINATLARL